MSWRYERERYWWKNLVPHSVFLLIYTLMSYSCTKWSEGLHALFFWSFSWKFRSISGKGLFLLFTMIVLRSSSPDMPDYSKKFSKLILTFLNYYFSTELFSFETELTNSADEISIGKSALKTVKLKWEMLFISSTLGIQYQIFRWWEEKKFGKSSH